MHQYLSIHFGNIRCYHEEVLAPPQQDVGEEWQQVRPHVQTVVQGRLSRLGPGAVEHYPQLCRGAARPEDYVMWERHPAALDPRVMGPADRKGSLTWYRPSGVREGEEAKWASHSISSAVSGE
ncbi:uncharacterized protein LOC143357545 [Halictus rubicundus]|uniref:uncharacterized protein LOC143357545 n=1 Tax=Halictus rubicundus TaxID=77578 RepID=UPI0040350C60